MLCLLYVCRVLICCALQWNEPGPLFDESGALAKEMMQLVPSLLSSEVGAGAQPRLAAISAVSQSGKPALLHAVARRERCGCVHVLLANNRNEPVRASVRFARGTAGIFERAGQLTHGLVPFELAIPGSSDVRRVDVINGSLHEWMGAWSTQVFRFNGTSTCATPWRKLAVDPPKDLVSNGGFESSGSYIAQPLGWSCGVAPRRMQGRRACFATAETSHSGRNSGRFSTAEAFGSFRIKVPLSKLVTSTDVKFVSWVRCDRAQTVSLYTKTPPPVSATTAPSWPALVKEELVGSVEASTNWTALVVPALTLAPGATLSLGVSKTGVLWLDDVSALPLSRGQLEREFKVLKSDDASFDCSSVSDCELNGACHNGACACFPGWRGPSCGSLKLKPAPAMGEGGASPYALYPQKRPLPPHHEGSAAVQGAIDFVTSKGPLPGVPITWGGSVAVDASGLRHLFVDVCCYRKLSAPQHCC